MADVSTVEVVVEPVEAAPVRVSHPLRADLAPPALKQRYIVGCWARVKGSRERVVDVIYTQLGFVVVHQPLYSRGRRGQRVQVCDQTQ